MKKDIRQQQAKLSTKKDLQILKRQVLGYVMYNQPNKSEFLNYVAIQVSEQKQNILVKQQGVNCRLQKTLYFKTIFGDIESTQCIKTFVAQCWDRYYQRLIFQTQNFGIFKNSRLQHIAPFMFNKMYIDDPFYCYLFDQLCKNSYKEPFLKLIKYDGDIVALSEKFNKQKMIKGETDQKILTLIRQIELASDQQELVVLRMGLIHLIIKYIYENPQGVGNAHIEELYQEHQRLSQEYSINFNVLYLNQEGEDEEREGGNEERDVVDEQRWWKY